MIGSPVGVRVYLAAGVTDMRKGFDGLAALVQQRLHQDPFGGAVYAFRGKRGDLVKLLWWDGQGLVLHAKALLSLSKGGWSAAGSRGPLPRTATRC